MKYPLLLSLGLHVGALVSLLSSAPTHRPDVVVELAVLETAHPASLPPSRGLAAAARKEVAPRRRARSTGARTRPSTPTRPPTPTPSLEPTTEALATAGLALRRRTGAHWSLSLRLDRFRSSPSRAAVEAIAERMPVLGAIAVESGRDALEIFDTLQISSIAFGGNGSTVWVARHRLEEGALVDALTRAARDAGVRLTEGRLSDLRCFDWAGEGAGKAVLLAGPTTLVIVDSSVRDAVRASGADWASLLPSIDGGDGPSPTDAVATFSSSWVPTDADRPASGRTPDRGTRGHALPPTLTAVLQIDPRPSLDVVAEFADEDAAGDWEQRLQQRGEAADQVSGWPTAFLPLVEGASVGREGRMVRVHEGLTVEELAAKFSPPTPTTPPPFAGRRTAGLSAMPSPQ